MHLKGARPVPGPTMMMGVAKGLLKPSFSEKIRVCSMCQGHLKGARPKPGPTLTMGMARASSHTGQF